MILNVGSNLKRDYIIRLGEHIKGGEEVARVVHPSIKAPYNSKVDFTNASDDTPLMITVTGTKFYT